jgi:hypothetical protein
MGTALARVYKSDGTIEDFKSCLYPCRREEFSTIPPGNYLAHVGWHGSNLNGFWALKMHSKGHHNDCGTHLNEINKKHKEQGQWSYGSDIHRTYDPGNLTGRQSNGINISENCLLIDYNKWSKFIAIFNTSSRKADEIPITISRDSKPGGVFETGYYPVSSGSGLNPNMRGTQLRDYSNDNIDENNDVTPVMKSSSKKPNLR